MLCCLVKAVTPMFNLGGINSHSHGRPLMDPLITCCPACSSQFRVTAEHLKIAGGMVKCGTCKEVFKASDNLPDEEKNQVATSTSGKFQFDQSAIDNSSAENILTKLDMPAINTFGEMQAVEDGDLAESQNEGNTESDDDELIMDTHMMPSVKDDDLSDEFMNLEGGTDSDDKFNTTVIESVSADGNKSPEDGK
jgi:predicted Zn finger-like uncharacterized protein